MSNLRLPGPVPVPPAVMAANSRPMIDHRGLVFAAILDNVTKGLKRWFKTEHDLFIFPSSGTGGLEAAVVNSFSPGDHVIAVSIGVFGERFASLAENFGLKVTKYAVDFGKAADPVHVGRLLDQHPDVKGVLVTHNETSTGVANDIGAIAKAVGGRALVIVDGVSSVGSLNFEMDAWGIDAAVTASQKGFMSPPGIAAVAVGPRVMAGLKTATLPRHYWDFARAKQYQGLGQTYTTPPVSTFYALEAGIKMMDAEGQEQVFKRHIELAQYTRQNLKALGFAPLADDVHFSPVVSAAWLPAGVDGKKLVALLRDNHDIIVSGGQQSLAGKIIRVGHVGWCGKPELDEVFNAIRVEVPNASARATVAAGA